KKCIGCGKCMRLCPAKAITMREKHGRKTPRIDRKKCIKCFCCQEFCPKAAMVVHRSAVVRILQK
ncbi:MAG: 4Fe-4S dicluster domain-containing protein, partial [Clostridia bacterium]|nr:4Fe-4S dicluster domain-containing protein [Clostridia bacterium]